MDHSADEAGGEAIFSYDGLPSLAAPLPPPSAGGPSAVGNTNDNEIGDALISTNNTFRTAFDSFNNAGTGWMGISHPTKNNATNISGGGGGGGGGWEDPRRKLYQLKSEIEQLETTFANEQQQQDKTVSDDIYNEEIQTEMEELKSRIVAMGLADDASLANMLRVRQEDLSRVIKDGSLSDGMENLSLQGKADDASKSTIVDSRKEAMLEERLRKLELVMGNSNNTSTNNGDKSIMERIQTAENLLNEVSPTQIDKLAAKAKVIRADLEAAARAKTKLASKSSSAAAGQHQKEDAAIIAALHSQLLELQGLSSHLPALTLRLAELSNLHSNAADFSSRLTAAEVAVGRSEGMLHNVNEALSSMETGWKDNMDRVEGNVKRLDELLLANKK